MSRGRTGPSLISNIYDEPVPWATFFAPGGIAFHGGSLTEWSHGCVHLTVSNAHYYNEHLPIMAWKSSFSYLGGGVFCPLKWGMRWWTAQLGELVGEVRAGRVARRAAGDDEARRRGSARSTTCRYTDRMVK